MTDFVISLKKRIQPDAVTEKELLYGANDVSSFLTYPYSWGVVVFEKKKTGIIFTGDDRKTILFRLGDVLIPNDEILIDRLSGGLLKANQDRSNANIKFVIDMINRINGAFVIGCAMPEGFCIITDPMSFIPVYLASDQNGQPVCIGTHLNSVVLNNIGKIQYDLVSVTEFIANGTCSFPFTVYENVKEINPGTIHFFNYQSKDVWVHHEYSYWAPPGEEKAWTEAGVAVDLKNALYKAINSRCNDRGNGVFLSGGLDSRIVAEVIPKSKECICFTFCNDQNRETKTAKAVAQSLNRQWYPLYRNEDYLSGNLLAVTNTIGCENDFVNAHGFGFSEEIKKYHITNILSGIYFDTYFKGIYLIDDEKIRQGALSTQKGIQLEKAIPSYLLPFLKNNIIEEYFDRKVNIYKKCNIISNIDLERTHLYPFSRNGAASWWLGHRRVLPEKLIISDRIILDIVFRCPAKLKKNGKLFGQVAKMIVEKSSGIPNANNGVCVGSGTVSRFIQRMKRKMEDKWSSICDCACGVSHVQHSWYDYQCYWKTNSKMKSIISENEDNLDYCDAIFKIPAREILRHDLTDWHVGFRLLQLSISDKNVRYYKKRMLGV
jgi:hypothetical protein